MKIVKDLHGNSTAISNEEGKVLDKVKANKELNDRDQHIVNRLISRGVLDDDARIQRVYKRGEE